jgi:excisionase family DNA binding protein
MNELYSVEQVAQRLGLHVRTVRTYVRDGRLRAVRIGKQYRIARSDLEELTGAAVTDPVPPPTRRHVEVSSIVAIDAISPEAAQRVSTTLVAVTNGPNDGAPVRVQTLYDPERGRLKVVILGDLADTTDLLRVVSAVLDPEE